MQEAQLNLQDKVMVTSETGWIDAQHTHLVARDFFLEAKKGSVFLENNQSHIGNQMLIQSKFGSLEASHIYAEKEFVFEGQRFKMRSSSLFVKEGDVSLNGLQSIHVDKGEIQAVGQVRENSEGWILGRQQETVAKEIARTATDIYLQTSSDQAERIANQAKQSLSQVDYEAEAENILLSSDGKSFFQNNQWNAQDIAVKAHTLWLNQAQVHFSEKLRILSEKAATINQLDAEGRTAKLSAKKKSLSVTNSKIKSKRGRYSAKKDLSFTHNVVEGSTRLKSGRHQHVAHNILHKGHVKLTSADGNMDVQSNLLLEMGSIETETPHGTTRYRHNRAEVDNVTGKGKEIHWEQGEIKSKGNVHLDAEKTRVSHINLNAQEISIKGKETNVVEQSHLQADHQLHLLTDGVALINKCKVQAKKINTSGNQNFYQTSLQAQQQIELKEGNLSVDNSQVHVESGPLSMKGKKINLRQSQLQATAIQQHAAEILSVASQTTASETIERKADHLALLEGRDQAKQITEYAKDQLLKSEHQTHALDMIEQSANQIFLRQTTEIAPTINFQGESIQGTQNRFQAKKWNVQAGKIELPETQAATEATTLHALRGAFIPSSKIQGDITINNHSQTLDLMGSSLNGSLHATSGGDILAASAEFRGEKANLQSGANFLGHDMQANLNAQFKVNAQNIYSPHMQLQSKGMSELVASQSAYLSDSNLQVVGNGLAIQGNFLNIDRSHIQADAVFESGKQGISATGSHTYVQDRLTQVAQSGSINLEKSYTHAGNGIARNAHSDINHSGAVSIANQHVIDAHSLNNQHGILSIGNETSRISTQHLYTDAESRIEGPGSVVINNVKDYEGHGTIKMGGSYTVKGIGRMTLNHSLEAHGAVFETNGTINNKAPIHLHEHGTFSGYQLQNNSTITSDGILVIDQQKYCYPQNVIAHENLILSSPDPIFIQHSPTLAGGLTLMSDSLVKTAKLLTVPGDFTVQGSAIEFQQPIDARVRGIFRSRGMVHFNHTKAFFGEGIDVHAGTFYSNVSKIDIVGRSRIKCHDFIIGSETKVTHSHLPHHHTPSSFNNEGDLYLETTGRAVNDASNILVGGNLFLRGKNLENMNRTHTHRYQVKVGTVAKKFCGIKYGSTSLYAQREDLIIDGVANTQVRKIFDIKLSGNLTNDGIIEARKIRAEAANLRNGIFN